LDCPAEQCAEIASAVSGSMFVQAMSEADAEWQRCLTHLTTAKVEWFSRGKKETIGELIRMTLRSPHRSRGGAEAATGSRYVRRVSRREQSAAEAAGQPKPQPREWIAVSYGHQGLEEIFKRHALARSQVERAVADGGRRGQSPRELRGPGPGEGVADADRPSSSRRGDEKYADDPEDAALVAEVTKSM
jgi:hypothetical protein